MADKYKITNQRQTTQLAPGGTFRQVMEVSFEVLSTGTMASIDIPLSRYTADAVREAIDAYVENIEAVHNL